jgi:hypothetical protein
LEPAVTGPVVLHDRGNWRNDATPPSQPQTVLAGDRQHVADVGSRQPGVDALDQLDLAGVPDELDDVAAQVEARL